MTTATSRREQNQQKNCKRLLCVSGTLVGLLFLNMLAAPWLASTYVSYQPSKLESSRELWRIEERKIKPAASSALPILTLTPAEAFYQDHFRSMTALVNESTGLNWEAGNVQPQHHFAPFKELLTDQHNDTIYAAMFPNRTVKSPLALTQSPFIHFPDICQAALAFSKYRQSNPSHPHVLIAKLNENWGEFSQPVPGKTASNYPGFYVGWIKQGCTKQGILEYMNHNDTRAIVTTQFQSFQHPKIYSLPLGIQYDWKVPAILKELQKPSNRSQLLMINSKRRPMRKAMLETIVQTFQAQGVFVRNTYRSYWSDKYFEELHRSKFILSPSGMGLDCYRHWEALYMGTIPVLEHLNRSATDGWFRSLEDLPVAWIDSYDNLTPQWLGAEYDRIVAKAHSYNYEKLTRKWWVDMIQSSLK